MITKEAIGIGTTVEQAKENALLSLAVVNDDDVQYEIIELPKAKILGLFGGAPAKVKAYIEMPDEVVKQKTKSDKPRKNRNDKTVKNDKNVKAEKPVKTEKKEKAEVSNNFEQDVNAVEISTLPSDSPAVKAANYLTTILNGLGCSNLEFKVSVLENGAILYLKGDGLGAAIGHRGETLDSLQYLASLAANTGSGYYKISVNIGNYRERREQTLISLAKRISSQVLKTGRSRTLEPMNPYERRIIHTAVQEIEGVSSNSVGEGNNRRVVISSDNPRPQNRRNGNNRSTNTAQQANDRAPRTDSEVPLYGKIN